MCVPNFTQEHVDEILWGLLDGKHLQGNPITNNKFLGHEVSKDVLLLDRLLRYWGHQDVYTKLHPGAVT